MILGYLPSILEPLVQNPALQKIKCVVGCVHKCMGLCLILKHLRLSENDPLPVVIPFPSSCTHAFFLWIAPYRHFTWIKPCTGLCDKLLSHGSVCGSFMLYISVLAYARCSYSMYEYRALFFHSSVGEFYFLAIMNNAAMNACVLIFI